MATDVDVLQVITTTSRRGAERFAVALEPELFARGLRVRTVALTAGEGPGLDVEPLGPSRLGRETIAALRSAARSSSVVLAHGSTTLPASYLALMGTRIPFVYRNIGDPAYWATTRARRLRSRLFLNRAAKVVALTDETGRRLSEYYHLPPERITAIPRGIPESEFPPRTPASRAAARTSLGVDQDARVLVCLGALSDEKDVPNAVRALALLPSRWRLLIAGDGPDRSSVEAEVARLGESRVRLLGNVDDPAGVLAAADLLVLPSRTEGLPGVVIEAAMMGIPSVVTDVGFVREIVEDGLSGHVVPPEDPDALAAAILASEPVLEALGEAAQRRVTSVFGLATVADRWRATLDPFVSSRSESEESIP